jgi:hypothetical protein
MSVVVGALAGVVGYLAWLLEISNNDWWPWALVGGILGLAVGVVAAWWNSFKPPTDIT